jgi:hypothetical protein
MKGLSKAQIKEFKKAVKEVLTSNGYAHLKGYTEFIYEKKTSVGTLKITLHDSDLMYSVYMKFGDDLNKSLFEQLRPNENYNKYSYKWNIHTESVEYAIEELKQRVKDLN